MYIQEVHGYSLEMAVMLIRPLIYLAHHLYYSLATAVLTNSVFQFCNHLFPLAVLDKFVANVDSGNSAKDISGLLFTSFLRKSDFDIKIKKLDHLDNCNRFTQIANGLNNK